ncbi:glycoside hydrolase family 108 protein [Pontibacter toksunensis]|uniref:Glycoside hydrolase family 108 protein n=1 Tax=Pontibacter toksunensis TaxID=1332631 RepID=A0ABW6BZF3_9BACT
MANYDISYRIVMGNEGGYANKSTDAGGETYKGISRKWWPKWAGWAIIDAVKAVRPIKWNEEIQDYYLKINVKTFYKAYWRSFGGDKLVDQDIANIMFDMYVLTGDDGVKIAQRVCNAMGYNLKVDGVMGDLTAGAINSLNPEAFFSRYFTAREKFHRAVAAGNAETGMPNLEGWLRRLYKFHYVFTKKKSLAC